MHERFRIRRVPAPPAVSARGITKTFARGLARDPERIVALESVDLAVYGGEVVGLAGSAGSGKTTLLQCMCGLLRSDSGSVRVCGELVEPQWRPRKIGFVQATPVYYPFATVRDVLELSVARRAVRPVGFEAIPRALAALELEACERKVISSLPREVLSRIAVAEALAARPGVILVDSSASGAHPPFDRVTLRALRACAETGMAIVVAARGVAAIDCAVTRVVVLEAGRATSRPRRFVAERVH